MYLASITIGKEDWKPIPELRTPPSYPQNFYMCMFPGEIDPVPCLSRAFFPIGPERRRRRQQRGGQQQEQPAHLCCM